MNKPLPPPPMAGHLSRRAFLNHLAHAGSAALLPGLLAACGAADVGAPASSRDGSIEDPMAPERLHRWVRELCAFQPRWAGYPAEAAAGQWLAGRLTDAGLNTQVHPYAMRKWQLNDWSVQLLAGGGPLPIKSFPIWSSRGGVGQAELVDVGLGTEAELQAKDIRGKAVVVTGKALLNVFASYPDTYQRAAELGAAAMFVTSDAPDNLIRPTSSSQNYLDDNPIPAFQLGARDLGQLRAVADTGAQVAWHLDAYHEDGTTHDIVARLPGSGALPGQLVICAHYDAWFSGALDNATGVAGLIGLAEHFGGLGTEQRPRDLLFLGVTGHDTGFPYGGMTHWLEQNTHQIDSIELFMNLDHLAAHGEEHLSGAGIIDGLGLNLERPGDEERALFTTHHPALARTFLPHLVTYGVLAGVFPTVPEVNANRDLEGATGTLGIPSVNLTMATPHYHTVEDTPERIPPEQLSRSVRAHRDFLTEIMEMSRSQIRSPV